MTAAATQAVPTSTRHRSRKFSAEPLVVAIPEEDLGPAMLELKERQRRFVLELRYGPAGYGSEVRAARAAGCTGSSIFVQYRVIVLEHCHEADIDCGAQTNDGDSIVCDFEKHRFATHSGGERATSVEQRSVSVSLRGPAF